MEAQYVLIGNSAATLAAIDWLRKYDRQARIVLIHRDAGSAYSRVDLPYYGAGERTPRLRPRMHDVQGGRSCGKAVQEEGRTRRLGARVEGVARKDAEVDAPLAGGATVRADMVAVAPGVKPNAGAGEKGPCKIN